MTDGCTKAHLSMDLPELWCENWLPWALPRFRVPQETPYRRSDLTVTEVARLLFVSRAHVLRLLQLGVLRRSVGKDGETVIDEESARTYPR